MKKLTSFALLSATLMLGGCATTQGITPQYINPNTYDAHTCQSLEQEIARVSRTAAATEKQQVGLSATGLGIGVSAGRGGIYPTISFGVGQSSGASSSKKATLAKLYGEHDAMVLNARQKGCAFAGGMKVYGE